MPAQRVPIFDTWQPGFGNAVVSVFVAGTTTLASLFTDEALQNAAPNPQTLVADTVNGVSAGKFSVPLYTSQAIEIEYNSTDQTGVIRPAITSMIGQDLSQATARAAGGTKDRSISSIVARVVYATDYGDLETSGDSSAATNTATLNAAIGAVSGNGGGLVMLPAGTYPFNQLNLSVGVILVGQGRGATILQSQVAGNVITLSGDRSGLSRLSLDGVGLVASSVGVFSKDRAEVVLDDCEIKRFETGIHCKGGTRAQWYDLYVTNCSTGAKLHGDLNAGGGADGGEFRNNAWAGGRVIQCTVIGVDFSWEDKLCLGNALFDVGFEDNTGTAIRVNGARFIRLTSCWFKGNTKNLDVLDDTNTSTAARRENTVSGLHIIGGTIEDGTATIKDTAQDVIFDGIDIKDVDFTIGTPISNNIVLIDCTEDSDVTIGGEGTRLARVNRVNSGRTSGLTTNATATKAWSIALIPGQLVRLNADVIARQRNAAAVASYGLSVTAYRPGSTLAYDTQTGNFTAGLIVTGQSSGATARIQADSDSGATGTLTLVDIDGDFIDNELITDTGGGSATVNGALVAQNAALKGAVAAPGTTYEDDTNWAATFAANGFEIELQVTGAANKTIEWDCDVRVTSN